MKKFDVTLNAVGRYRVTLAANTIEEAEKEAAVLALMYGNVDWDVSDCDEASASNFRSPFRHHGVGARVLVDRPELMLRMLLIGIRSASALKDILREIKSDSRNLAQASAKYEAARKRFPRRGQLFFPTAGGNHDWRRISPEHRAGPVLQLPVSWLQARDKLNLENVGRSRN
jgi:hypothetical protein